MLVTRSRLRGLAQRRVRVANVTAASILHESAVSQKSSYDVFLSHSSMDKDLVLGAKELIESYGFTVYVDWIDDPQLIRSSVNATSAGVIRRRMQTSTMLLYAHTLNSSVSRWCPWELGYFDGLRGGNVFILPIGDGQHSFTGQEYLGLYPFVDEALNKANTSRLWINKGDKSMLLETAKTKVIQAI